MDRPIGTRRIWAACRTAIAALTAVWIAGCSWPGFLITPVNTRQAFVETELSRDSVWATDKIALIDVSGTISDARSQQLLGSGENPVSAFLEQLDKARRDRRVKGVILRINSPGGTVVASELMHDEITHFKKSGKPIIAVMMDVAASGAYYISCACDEIIAQPSTVTGSIGVIMRTFDLSGTMAKLGVKSEAIVSGEYKDLGSMFRTLRSDERELFQGIIDEMYNRFVAAVVAGRPKLDEAQVRHLADGRVYTAAQALEAGLIDRIASLRESVRLLKKRTHSRKTRLVAYHRPMDYRPNYYASTPSPPAGNINLVNLDLSTLPDLATPQFLYMWVPGVR